jgi:hypothetical protein
VVAFVAVLAAVVVGAGAVAYGLLMPHPTSAAALAATATAREPCAVFARSVTITLTSVLQGR